MSNIKIISGAAAMERKASVAELRKAVLIIASKLMATATNEQTMKREYVKKFLIMALEAAVLLIAFDLIILFASLAQIALEGKTGYWNPFWRVQAEFVIKLLLAK
jgi:hypothetical protein